MKVSAKDVCDELNLMLIGGDKVFESILSRINVTESVALNTDISCSSLGNGKFDTSCLGFINGLLDETICYIDGEECFKLVSDANKELDAAWDKYLFDIKELNEKHGTSHKPEKRG